MLVGHRRRLPAACDRVLVGCPPPARCGAIARALGSWRRVGGRAAAARALRRLLYRARGPARAPRVTPGPWPETPPCRAALAGARRGRLAWWGPPRGGPPLAKGARDGPRPSSSNAACFRRPSFSHVLANVLPINSEPEPSQSPARLQHAQPSICSAAAFRSTAHSLCAAWTLPCNGAFDAG